MPTLIQVRFHDQALEELSEAERYYSSKSPSLGVEFIDAIEHAVARLRPFPESGSLYHEGSRRLLLDRFPFGVIYSHEKVEVVILAVAHQRRKPGYWHDRR